MANVTGSVDQVGKLLKTLELPKSSRESRMDIHLVLIRLGHIHRLNFLETFFDSFSEIVIVGWSIEYPLSQLMPLMKLQNQNRSCEYAVSEKFH